jgi:hypothetical protein
MQIEIDLSTVPPTTTLCDPDDFKGFKVVVRGDDAFVSPDALRALAGDRADDPQWTAQLDGMIGYAASKGWIRESDGAIQAHVERA